MKPSRGYCLDSAVLSLSLARAYRRMGHARAALAYLHRAAMWRRAYLEATR